MKPRIYFRENLQLVDNDTITYGIGEYYYTMYKYKQINIEDDSDEIFNKLESFGEVNKDFIIVSNGNIGIIYVSSNLLKSKGREEKLNGLGL